VNNTGQVFNAISERRGQLQGLIRNANTVFTTTAQRDRELKDLFTVFPTFNRESQATVDRLTAFARNSNPLVTQLRPAARELSPTLQQLSLLAPDLKALFRDLDPLITASRTGLPALQRFLEELRPALGEFDPTLKQLNPLLNWVGNYKSELRSFFANVPSATQATTPDGVHYLRTANPLNPENLAVYPRRPGSNRNNAYMLPDGFKNLPQGLLGYETRQCGNGNPETLSTDQLSAALHQVMPWLSETLQKPTNPLAAPPPSAPALASNILSFVFNNAGRQVPAPPCRQQGPFTVNEGKLTTQGQTSQYPHVQEARSSTSSPTP
jgi:hypothetical protein